MHEAANQNWTTRALERQIGTLYYERLLASQDREAVQHEAASHIDTHQGIRPRSGSARVPWFAKKLLRQKRQ